LGAFFLKLGAMGQKSQWKQKKKIFIGGIFFKNWGHFFKKLGAFFFANWGHFFFKLGAMGQMCQWNKKKIFIGGTLFKNWGHWG